MRNRRVSRGLAPTSGQQSEPAPTTGALSTCRRRCSVGFARWGGAREPPPPAPPPQVGAGCRNTYCRSVLSLRTPCPHLWGRGLGVGAREPHRSLPASGTSGGFLDPMGASDFDPAAVRAQARFPRPALVRRFPGLCFSRVTSVPRIPAYPERGDSRYATASPSNTHCRSFGTRACVPGAGSGRTSESVCHNSIFLFAYAGSRATARNPTSAFAE